MERKKKGVDYGEAGDTSGDADNPQTQHEGLEGEGGVYFFSQPDD